MATLAAGLALVAALACGSGSSEVTVGPGGANPPPLAADKVVRLHNSRHPFSISLPAVDAEGDPCGFEIVQAPSHGTHWRLNASRIAEAPQRMHRILNTPAEDQIHDSNQGVACSGVQRLFLVGNVFHDLHDASEYEGDALRFWGRGDAIEIVNNTMVRVDNGVNYRGGLSVGYPWSATSSPS